MTTQPKTLTLLTVCAANHCRSRALESLLRSHCLPNVIVESAGVNVVEPMPLCGEVANWLDQRKLAYDSTRLSRQLTRQMVESADLVLASDAAVRGEIGKIAPDLRERVIPVSWAAAAGAALLENKIVERAVEAHFQGNAYVVDSVDGESFVAAAALDPNNFQPWLTTELRSTPNISHSGIGWDIADVHMPRRESHEKLWPLLKDSSDHIAQIIVELQRVTAVH